MKKLPFKIKKIMALIFVIATIISFGAVATACQNKEGDPKPSVEAVLANLQAASSFGASADINLGLKAYGADGSPIKLGQNINVNRTAVNDLIYGNFTVKTTEFDISGLGLAGVAVAMFLQEMPEVAAYLNKNAHIMAEFGIGNGVVNARGDYVGQDGVIDYKFTNKNKTYNLFTALSLTDIAAFVADVDMPQLAGFSLTEAIMTPLLLTLDWTQAVDAASKNYQSKGNDVCMYELTLSSDYLWSYALQMIRDNINITWPADGEGEQGVKDKETNTELHAAVDYMAPLVKTWLTYNLKLTLTADGAGRVQNALTTFSLNVKIPPQHIMQIAEHFNIEEEMEMPEGTIEGMVGMLLGTEGSAGILGNSAGTQNYFEIDAAISVNESYKYDNLSIDGTSAVFAPIETDTEGRFILQYKYDENEDEYVWTYDGFVTVAPPAEDDTDASDDSGEATALTGVSEGEKINENETGTPTTGGMGATDM